MDTQYFYLIDICTGVYVDIENDDRLESLGVSNFKLRTLYTGIYNVHQKLLSSLVTDHLIKVFCGKEIDGIIDDLKNTRLHIQRYDPYKKCYGKIENVPRYAIVNR